MFSSRQQRAEPIELADQFTPEEANRITQLRGRYRSSPLCFKLDINYQRLQFARWLLEHGRLDERGSMPADRD